MKKLGLIGGVGPASTVDYYNYVIDGWRKATDSSDYPEFSVENVNMTEMLDYLERREYGALAQFLAARIERLKNAGADFAAIASNTPHIVLDELKRISPLPILSIIDSACAAARDNGIKKLLVLGTKFTMTSGLYDSVLPSFGVTPVLPSDCDKETVHSIIFPKLEDGIVVPEDKNRLIKLIEQYKNDCVIDGVLLGCTELPLMLKQSDFKDLNVLDTAAIHAAAIVKEMLK